VILVDSFGLWTWKGVLIGAGVVAVVTVGVIATGGVGGALFAPVIAGALVGGGIGAVKTGTIEGTITGAIAGAAGGAVVGVALPVGASLGLGTVTSSTIAGAAGGVTKVVIGGLLVCGSVTQKQVLQGAVGGALGGFIGAGLLGVAGSLSGVGPGAELGTAEQLVLKFDISAAISVGTSAAELLW
jgi:hypothetical protein